MAWKPGDLQRRIARGREKYAGREEQSSPPVLHVTCPRCVNLSGSCCLCSGTRRIDYENIFREMPTVNVPRCAAFCDVCRALTGQARKRVA